MEPTIAPMRLAFEVDAAAAALIGVPVGTFEWSADGVPISLLIGAEVGRVGCADGVELGGSTLGDALGSTDGSLVGSKEGSTVGSKVGATDGSMVGS